MVCDIEYIDGRHMKFQAMRVYVTSDLGGIRFSHRI